ncbi:MAG: hypothetical protein ACREEM_22695 [Blastocatellia bacterium]
MEKQNEQAILSTLPLLPKNCAALLRQIDGTENAALSTAAHTAYHFGAIRQILAGAYLRDA